MASQQSPFLISVIDLIRRPGEMREFALEEPMGEEMAIAVIGVAADEPVAVEGRFESLHDGILVTADVESVARGECVRCLTELAQPVEVEIQEVFAYDEDEAFEYRIQDDHVNLEPVIRDAVVLALPFQPVCQDDCPGLCPECGVRLLDNPGHEHEEPIDPRWAALAKLEGLTGADTEDDSRERPSGDADREKR